MPKVSAAGRQAKAAAASKASKTNPSKAKTSGKRGGKATARAGSVAAASGRSREASRSCSPRPSTSRVASTSSKAPILRLIPPKEASKVANAALQAMNSRQIVEVPDSVPSSPLRDMGLSDEDIEEDIVEDMEEEVGSAKIQPYNVYSSGEEEVEDVEEKEEEEEEEGEEKETEEEEIKVSAGPKIRVSKASVQLNRKEKKRSKVSSDEDLPLMYDCSWNVFWKGLKIHTGTKPTTVGFTPSTPLSEYLIFGPFHANVVKRARRYAADAFGINTPVCLVGHNVMAEISWTKSHVNERRSLSFDKDDTPSVFQSSYEQVLRKIGPKNGLRVHFDYKFARTSVGPPPEAKPLTKSQRTVTEQQQKEEANKRMAAMETQVQEEKANLEHRVTELMKLHRCDVS